MLAVVLAALLAVTVGAAPASAHTELTSTSPSDGQTVPSAPEAVTVTFSEPVVSTQTSVVVTGPDGEVQQGPPQVKGTDLIQPLRSGTVAGRYTVTWRTTAEDGDPISGSFSFAHRGGQPSSTAPAPGSGQSSPLTGLPGWASILIGIAAVALGVKVARDSKGRRER
jgi:hypothetical protein